MKLQALVTVCRDIALTFIGLAGIVHQEVWGPVKPELLVVYTTILGIPGVANLIALMRSPAPTGTPQLESQPSSSSPP